MPMDNQSITLSDGGSLGFQCLGDPNGRPLFFFHGSPGSRLVLSDDDLLAQIPGVRLIVPERPGCTEFRIPNPGGRFSIGRTMLPNSPIISVLNRLRFLERQGVALTPSPALIVSPAV